MQAIKLIILATVYFFCPAKAKYPFAKASIIHKLFDIVLIKRYN